MKSLVFACLVLAAVVAGVQGASPGEGWAQFRGPGGLGVSKDRGLPTTWGPTENIVWKTELPGAGASSPVAVGARLFLTSYSGFGVPGRPGEMDQLKRHVVCLDRSTGKLLWNQEVPASLPEQRTIRESHGYASGTPAADAERAYVFLGKSGVAAFSHDGRKLWQADVGSGLNGFGSGTSPVLHGDLVIVNASVESSSLVALDRKTGKEAWRAGGIRESWNTPILVTAPGGKTELAVAIMGKVLGFDPDTGKPLWSCTTGIPWYMVPGLVAHDGVVYCVGGRDRSNGALAVRAGGRGDVTTTHRLWSLRGKGTNVPSPVFHDGHLYWAHENLGVVYCVEAATGRVVREERLERADQIYASPVLADGKLYFVTRRGRTFVLAAKPSLEQLAVNDLKERTVFNASPAIVDGRLLLRTDRYLYCIGKK